MQYIKPLHWLTGVSRFLPAAALICTLWNETAAKLPRHLLSVQLFSSLVRWKFEPQTRRASGLIRTVMIVIVLIFHPVNTAGTALRSTPLFARSFSVLTRLCCSVAFLLRLFMSSVICHLLEPWININPRATPCLLSPHTLQTLFSAGFIKLFSLNPTTSFYIPLLILLEESLMTSGEADTWVINIWMNEPLLALHRVQWNSVTDLHGARGKTEKQSDEPFWKKICKTHYLLYKVYIISYIFYTYGKVIKKSNNLYLIFETAATKDFCNSVQDWKYSNTCDADDWRSIK